MKIAMLQTPMFPLNLTHCAGVERVELCELEYLQKLGHEIKLFVPELIGNNKHINQIKDLGWQNRYLKFFYYLNFGYKARSYDIFHGHYTPILALLYPGKSIIHYHGQAVFMLPKYEVFKNRYHKAHYIFNSKSTMKVFVDAYPDIPQDDLHLLYNGVDIERFQPKRNFNKKEEITKLCFCGRWKEEKGIFVLLDAIKILEQKRKDFRLYIIGSAHIPMKTEKSKQREKKITRIASELSTVEIIGPMEHEKLPAFYQQMDFGIVPSVWREPFGIVAVEMMASQLAVVATKVGAIPEIINDGIDGVLVEPNNPGALASKIELMIDYPDLRRKLGEEGRKKVKDCFIWEKHIGDLLKIYSQIIG